MVPIGTGDFYLYLHSNVRQAAGVRVGDTITVTIWLDEEYRNGPQHQIPAWFKDDLRENSVAFTAWQKLSPSRQKEVLRYFDGLQSEVAQKRNLALIMQALSGEPTHFIGRDWREGK